MGVVTAAHHLRQGAAVPAVGVAVAFLGLLVIVGWHAAIEPLIRVQPGFPPMQYNAAVGFLLAGGALVALGVGRPRLGSATGVAVALWGLVTLLQDLLGLSLGIDQLFIETDIAEEAAHPGRMAPTTGFSLLLSGTALALAYRWPPSRARLAAMGLLATTVVTLGLLAVFGYIGSIEATFGWGRPTRMAVHGAAGFLGLGSGILVIALRTDIPRETHPRWMAAGAALAVALVGVTLWRALDTAERSRMEETVRGATLAARAEVRQLLEARSNALVRMARRWEEQGRIPRRLWEADAALYLEHWPGLVAIVWADSSYTLRWKAVDGTEPETDSDLASLYFEHGVLQAARRDKTPVVFTSKTPGETPVLRMVFPLFLRGITFDGFLAGTFHPDLLLAAVAKEQRGMGYAFSVVAGDTHLFGERSGHEGESWAPPFGSETPLSYEDLTWQIRLAMTPERIATSQTALPEAALIGSLLIAALVGITIDRARAAQLRAREVQRSSGLHQTLTDTVPHLLWVSEPDAGITHHNPAWYQLTHRSKEDSLGKRWLEAVHPDDREAIMAAWALGERFTIECRLMSAVGAYRIISLVVTPWKNGAGKIVLWVGVGTDITDVRRAERELRTVNERLEHQVAERTEALARYARDLERSNAELEQFAYVASHDLQEPLRMIGSYTQLLARRYAGKLDGDASEFIGYAVDGAHRMQQLINDLLAYSRVGAGGVHFAPTDCQQVIDSVLLDLKIVIEERDAVVTVAPLPTVEADAGQLGQLFRNLIGNAIKFSAGAPQIRIDVKDDGDAWLFRVCDNGIGIDPQYADRIFVIFQRLHAPGEYSGTGIGLAICKRIVERHGGSIWMEPAAGAGSTFYFTLPKHRTSTS